MRRLACAVLVALLAPAAAGAGTIAKTYTVGGATKQVFIHLPKAEYPSYDITLHGSAVKQVKIDLRRGSRSVGHPGIQTCLIGVCNYSYSPQNTGSYTVVLSKPTGGAAKIAVKIIW